jgi:nitric oxide dioxygenase
LSDRPRPEHFRISVKRESRSRFGSAGIFSNHLHDSVKEGETVPIGPPAGDFFLPEDLTRPVVLLSGGIGITPLLSMLAHLSFRGHPAPVYFIHGTDNCRTHAFRDEVAELCSRRPQFIRHIRYAKPTPRCVPDRDYDGAGRLNVALVVSLVRSPLKAEYFLCGPESFMRAFYGGLIHAGIAARHIHFEFFGPHAAVTGGGGRR